MSKRSKRQTKKLKHLANDLQVYGLPPLHISNKQDKKSRGPVEAKALRQHGDPKYAPILAQALAKTGKSDQATHGFHSYPAGMHPACASLIIEAFPGAVHDPFCGGGTVLVEGKLAGRKISGNDLSPIASLVTNARCSSPSMATPLRAAARRIANEARKRINVQVPEEATEWYETHVAQELGRIRNGIANEEPKIQPLLNAVFSSILIKTSFRKSDTSNHKQRYQRPPGTTATLFHKKARELGRMLEKMPEEPTPVLTHGSACHTPPPHPVDLILTSPPYPGVYDYLPLQQLRLSWLNLHPTVQFNQEIGSRRSFRAKGRKNALSTWQADTQLWIKTQADALNPNGVMVIVVGDAIVGGKLVDALYPTVESMKESGLQIVARASADRPDHARQSIRIEHLVMGRKKE